MNNEYNNESVNNQTNGNDGSDYAYKNVMSGKGKSRSMSILSLIFALLSLAMTLVTPILGIVFGVGAGCVGLVSRKNLGYFDHLSLIGIIGAIFGFVFSVTVILIRSFVI